MAESAETKVTKVLNNVIIKPTWEKYSPTEGDVLTVENDNIKSQENLVTSLSKIQAWIEQIDSSVITKEELGDTNVARIKGIVDSKEDLPATGNKSGDIYLVKLPDTDKEGPEENEGEAPVGDLYESYIWIVESEFTKSTTPTDPDPSEEDPDPDDHHDEADNPGPPSRVNEEEEEEPEEEEATSEEGHWEYVGKHNIITPMDAYTAGAGIVITEDEDDETAKTIKVKLASETKLKTTATVTESTTTASDEDDDEDTTETDETEVEDQVYATRLDADGNLATVVPWTDRKVEQRVIKIEEEPEEPEDEEDEDAGDDSDEESNGSEDEESEGEGEGDIESDTTPTTPKEDSKGFYSLLFGGTKLNVVASNGELTTDDVKKALSEDKTEIGHVNKTPNLFINVGKNGQTTLYSDIFVGLTPTQDPKTCDNQMASTEFVHKVLENALLSDEGIKSIFEGQGPIEVSYHAAGSDPEEDPAKTYISHKKPTDFTAASTEGIYKIKTDDYGHVTKATKASVDDLTELEAYKGTAKKLNGNTLVLTLNSTTNKIEIEDWSVLQLNCVADDKVGGAIESEADELKATLEKVNEVLSEVL